jgi:hypothetical protein
LWRTTSGGPRRVMTELSVTAAVPLLRASDRAAAC